MTLLPHGTMYLTNDPMKERISKIWFAEGRICITTDKGDERSLPLELFPELYYATPSERERFYIWDDGMSIRWQDLDADIHISNFHEAGTIDRDNETNKILSKFPCLDLKAFAGYIGIHWTKLAKYKLGAWKPTPEMLEKIKRGALEIARQTATAAATI